MFYISFTFSTMFCINRTTTHSIKAQVLTVLPSRKISLACLSKQNYYTTLCKSRSDLFAIVFMAWICQTFPWAEKNLPTIIRYRQFHYLQHPPPPSLWRNGNTMSIFLSIKNKYFFFRLGNVFISCYLILQSIYHAETCKKETTHI